MQSLERSAQESTVQLKSSAQKSQVSQNEHGDSMEDDPKTKYLSQVPSTFTLQAKKSAVDQKNQTGDKNTELQLPARLVTTSRQVITGRMECDINSSFDRNSKSAIIPLEELEDCAIAQLIDDSLESPRKVPNLELQTGYATSNDDSRAGSRIKQPGDGTPIPQSQTGTPLNTYNNILISSMHSKQGSSLRMDRQAEPKNAHKQVSPSRRKIFNAMQQRQFGANAYPNPLNSGSPLRNLAIAAAKIVPSKQDPQKPIHSNSAKSVAEHITPRKNTTEMPGEISSPKPSPRRETTSIERNLSGSRQTTSVHSQGDKSFIISPAMNITSYQGRTSQEFKKDHVIVYNQVEPEHLTDIHIDSVMTTREAPDPETARERDRTFPEGLTHRDGEQKDRESGNKTNMTIRSTSNTRGAIKKYDDPSTPGPLIFKRSQTDQSQAELTNAAQRLTAVYCETKQKLPRGGSRSPYQITKLKQAERVRRVELNRRSQESFQQQMQKRSNENLMHLEQIYKIDRVRKREHPLQRIVMGSGMRTPIREQSGSGSSRDNDGNSTVLVTATSPSPLEELLYESGKIAPTNYPFAYTGPPEKPMKKRESHRTMRKQRSVDKKQSQGTQAQWRMEERSEIMKRETSSIGEEPAKFEKLISPEITVIHVPNCDCSDPNKQSGTLNMCTTTRELCMQPTGRNHGFPRRFNKAPTLAGLLKVSPSRISASTNELSQADMLHSNLKIAKVKQTPRFVEIPTINYNDNVTPPHIRHLKQKQLRGRTDCDSMIKTDRESKLSGNGSPRVPVVARKTSYGCVVLNQPSNKDIIEMVKESATTSQEMVASSDGIKEAKQFNQWVDNQMKDMDSSRAQSKLVNATEMQLNKQNSGQSSLKRPLNPDESLTTNLLQSVEILPCMSMHAIQLTGLANQSDPNMIGESRHHNSGQRSNMGSVLREEIASQNYLQPVGEADDNTPTKLTQQTQYEVPTPDRSMLRTHRRDGNSAEKYRICTSQNSNHNQQSGGDITPPPLSPCNEEQPTRIVFKERGKSPQISISHHSRVKPTPSTEHGLQSAMKQTSPEQNLSLLRIDSVGLEKIKMSHGQQTTSIERQPTQINRDVPEVAIDLNTTNCGHQKLKLLKKQAVIAKLAKDKLPLQIQQVLQRGKDVYLMTDVVGSTLQSVSLTRIQKERQLELLHKQINREIEMGISPSLAGDERANEFDPDDLASSSQITKQASQLTHFVINAADGHGPRLRTESEMRHHMIKQESNQTDIRPPNTMSTQQEKAALELRSKVDLLQMNQSVHTHTETGDQDHDMIDNLPATGVASSIKDGKLIDSVGIESALKNSAIMEMASSQGVASSLKEQAVGDDIVKLTGTPLARHSKKDRTGGIKKLELHVTTPTDMLKHLPQSSNSPQRNSRMNKTTHVFRHAGTSAMKSDLGSEASDMHVVGGVNYHQQQNKLLSQKRAAAKKEIGHVRPSMFAKTMRQLTKRTVVKDDPADGKELGIVGIRAGLDMDFIIQQYLNQGNYNNFSPHILFEMNENMSMRDVERAAAAAIIENINAADTNLKDQAALKQKLSKGSTRELYREAEELRRSPSNDITTNNRKSPTNSDPDSTRNSCRNPPCTYDQGVGGLHEDSTLVLLTSNKRKGVRASRIKHTKEMAAGTSRPLLITSLSPHTADRLTRLNLDIITDEKLLADHLNDIRDRSPANSQMMDKQVSVLPAGCEENGMSKVTSGDVPTQDNPLTSKFSSNQAIENVIVLGQHNIFRGDIKESNIQFNRVFRNSDSQSQPFFQNSNVAAQTQNKRTVKNKTNSNHAVVVNRVIRSPLEKHDQLQQVTEERQTATIQQSLPCSQDNVQSHLHSYDYSNTNTANPEQSNATLLQQVVMPDITTPVKSLASAELIKSEGTDAHQVAAMEDILIRNGFATGDAETHTLQARSALDRNDENIMQTPLESVENVLIMAPATGKTTVFQYVTESDKTYHYPESKDMGPPRFIPSPDQQLSRTSRDQWRRQQKFAHEQIQEAKKSVDIKQFYKAIDPNSIAGIQQLSAKPTKTDACRKPLDRLLTDDQMKAFNNLLTQASKVNKATITRTGRGEVSIMNSTKASFYTHKTLGKANGIAMMPKSVQTADHGHPQPASKTQSNFHKTHHHLTAPEVDITTSQNSSECTRRRSMKQYGELIMIQEHVALQNGTPIPQHIFSSPGSRMSNTTSGFWSPREGVTAVGTPFVFNDYKNLAKSMNRNKQLMCNRGMAMVMTPASPVSHTSQSYHL